MWQIWIQLKEIHANLLGAGYMNHLCHLAVALNSQMRNWYTMAKSLDYTIQNQTDCELLEWPFATSTEFVARVIVKRIPLYAFMYDLQLVFWQLLMNSIAPCFWHLFLIWITNFSVFLISELFPSCLQIWRAANLVLSLKHICLKRYKPRLFLTDLFLG